MRGPLPQTTLNFNFSCSCVLVSVNYDQMPLVCFSCTQQAQSACFPCCLQLREDGVLSDREKDTSNKQQEDEKDAAAGTKTQAQTISALFKVFASVT